MAACGHAALRPQRSADCLAHGKQADAPCAPLRRTEPSNPGANRNPVPGGHTGRPYERTGGVSVGADFISAQPGRRVGCTRVERTDRRGAHGASETGCDFYRAVGQRDSAMAACGHAALRPQRSADCLAHGKQADAPCAPLRRTEPSNPGANRNPVPGGHTGRPYERTGGVSVGADFISAQPARRVGCTPAERIDRRFGSAFEYTQ